MHQQYLAALLVLHDEGGAGHRVADLVVAELLAPDHLAGVLVEGDDGGVQRAEVDLVAVDGGAPVDHVAARADIVRQAGFVLPEALPAPRIDREDAGIRGGDVDHAVVHQGLCLLPALLFAAEGEAPGRHQAVDVLRIDLGQRAVALRLQAQTIGKHVLRGLVVIEDIFPAHRFAGQRGGAERGRNQGGKQRPAGGAVRVHHVFLVSR